LSYEVSRQVERKEQQQSSNEAFTQGIKDCFSNLRPWKEAGIHSDLSLQLKCYSPSDHHAFQKQWATSFPSLSETSSIANLSRSSYLNINGNSIVKHLLPDILYFLGKYRFPHLGLKRAGATRMKVRSGSDDCILDRKRVESRCFHFTDYE
jgi:hypothetical protein